MCVLWQYSGIIPDVQQSVDPTNRTNVLRIIDRGKVTACCNVFLVLSEVLETSSSYRIRPFCKVNLVMCVYELQKNE